MKCNHSIFLTHLNRKMSMLDKTTHLYDDKQFIFLQDVSDRTLSKALILLVLQSHELLFTLHITHQSTSFIYLFYQDESKFERISSIQQVFQKLSRKQLSPFLLSVCLALDSSKTKKL